MTLVGFVPDLGSTPKVGVFIFRDPRDLRVAALRFDDLGDPKVNGVSKGPSADLRAKEKQRKSEGKAKEKRRKSKGKAKEIKEPRPGPSWAGPGPPKEAIR